ncbi:hypothetical protein MKK63_04180 [Methylobacterium sp. J-088]|uniref:hypothetical protein n=1 Tax=Methylobacterium sp. J-088 TaxID=2836664 RepID=UPI001FB8D9D9|nr:hypothetical protein [Methylobacterium sp. J-088]MCJ2061898.1 hypothetical protein [Methylobacterium sp. J-088]
MTQARPIPQKVVRLVPMLGSPADHEALSAARAIGRVLGREGLGFTDLAAAIPTGATVDNIHGSGLSRRRDNSVDANRIRPFATFAWKRAYTPRQESEHRRHVRFCLSRPWSFSARERTFLADIAKLHGNLTIRQGDWLADLTDRLDEELRTP